MNVFHHNLAAGRWVTFSFCEQLGNVGAEAMRVVSLGRQGRYDLRDNAAYRMLELIDLTLEDARWRGRMKELCRLREVVCDWVWGDNKYGFDAEKYFLPFALAARKDK
ncbi:MAG TPA: hypothetical protein VJB93_03735 [Patescibacteria group bacterium]|nr:hypothetical protein [Patescibacteria group bacterium]